MTKNGASIRRPTTSRLNFVFITVFLNFGGGSSDGRHETISPIVERASNDTASTTPPAMNTTTVSSLSMMFGSQSEQFDHEKNELWAKAVDNTTTSLPSLPLMYSDVVKHNISAVKVTPDEFLHTLLFGHNIYLYPIIADNMEYVKQLVGEVTTGTPACQRSDEGIQQYWILVKKSGGQLRIPIEVLVTCNNTITRDSYNKLLLSFIQNISSVQRPDKDEENTITKMNIRDMTSLYGSASVYEYGLATTESGTSVLSTTGNNLHVMDSFYNSILYQFPYMIRNPPLYHQQCVVMQNDGNFVPLVDNCAIIQRMTYRNGTVGPLSGTTIVAGSPIRFVHMHCCCRTSEKCVELMPQYRNQAMCITVKRHLFVNYFDNNKKARVYEKLTDHQVIQPIEDTRPTNTKRCHLLISLQRIYSKKLERVEIKINISDIRLLRCDWENYYGDVEECAPILMPPPDIHPTNRYVCCNIKCDEDRKDLQDALVRIPNLYMIAKASTQLHPDREWVPTEAFSSDLYDCIHYYVSNKSTRTCFITMNRVNGNDYVPQKLPVAVPQEVIVAISGKTYNLSTVFGDGGIEPFPSELYVPPICTIVGMAHCRFDDSTPESERTLRRCAARQQGGYHVTLMCWCKFRSHEPDFKTRICDQEIVEGVNNKQIDIHRVYCRSHGERKVITSESEIFCYEKLLYDKTDGPVQRFGFVNATDLYERLGNTIDCLPNQLSVDQQCTADYDGFICCCMAKTYLDHEPDEMEVCNNGGMVKRYVANQHFLELSIMQTTFQSGAKCESAYTLDFRKFGYGYGLQPLCLFVLALTNEQVGELVPIEKTDTGGKHLIYEEYRLVDLSHIMVNMTDWNSYLEMTLICRSDRWSPNEHIRGCACRSFLVDRPEARVACCCSDDLANDMAIDMVVKLKKTKKFYEP